MKYKNGTFSPIKLLARSTWILYLLPVLILFGLFLLYPIISILQLSFFKWDGLSPQKVFSGFLNYKYVFSDADFRATILNTLKCLLYGPIPQTAISLVLAVMISNVFRGKLAYRAFLYTPVILPLIASAVVWFNILSPGIGLLDQFIRFLGFPKFNLAWLGDTSTALPSVIFITAWRWAGFNVVIFMTGLQNISNEYYEAAKIDGANAWQSFSKITYPLIRTSVEINFCLNLFGYLKLFDVIYVTTGGGPANSTEVLATYIYKQAFQYNDVGMAAAASVILFIIIAFFSGIYFYLIKRKSD